jgi:hypothetical protein
MNADRLEGPSGILFILCRMMRYKSHQCKYFEKNRATVKDRLVLKLCQLHPGRIFSILQQNPDVPFADSLVRAIAKKYPRQLYDYAAAGNKLGVIIRNISDDMFIKTIATMARSKSGQQYFPFLDNIVNGKLTLKEIDAAKDDSVLYYQLLVKTQMDYVARAINKDTAFEFKSLTRRLEDKAKADFINILTALMKKPEIPSIAFKH